MTQDEMEAQSWRYGPKLVMVVPLTSGRLAVCSPRRDIIGYCYTIEDAVTITHAYHNNLTAKQAFPDLDFKDLL